MWVRRWHGKRYGVPRWREHGGPGVPDAPLTSFRRVTFSVLEWAWLLYWPDVPIYIPFWRMVVYNYRPHAAERYDFRRTHGRSVRGVSQVLAVYRQEQERGKQAMSQDDETQTQNQSQGYQGTDSDSNSDSGAEASTEASTEATGATGMLGDTGDMGDTGDTPTNNPVRETRPESMSYGDESKAYGVFTSEMLTSLIQGHGKWGGWANDSFDMLFERAGRDWDAAVEAVNIGHYQDAMRNAVNIANRMLMIFQKSSAALNQASSTTTTTQG